MATLPKVLINQADSKSAGGVALRVRTQGALLLSKAKDNNASTSLGPFIRLFDSSFSLDDVRRSEVVLHVKGTDGFELDGVSAMSQISRDPEDLVQQTIGRTHQYPDGFILFLGTMFAPTKVREGGGGGFTHKSGDIVAIGSAELGTLVNRVRTSDQALLGSSGYGP